MSVRWVCDRGEQEMALREVVPRQEFESALSQCGEERSKLLLWGPREVIRRMPSLQSRTRTSNILPALPTTTPFP